MRTIERPTATLRPTPGARTSILAGLLTGAIVGLIGAVASVPLRRLAAVSDRSVVNGLSVAGGALVLWLLLGALHAALRDNPRIARTAVLVLASSAAVVVTVIVYTALRDFAVRLPSLAEPLALLVIPGGAALFLTLVARPLSIPLPVVAPAGLVAAIVAAGLVSAIDRKPSVHYTLSKLPAAPAASAGVLATAAAASGAAAIPATSGTVSGGTTASPTVVAGGGASSAQAAPIGTLHFTVSSGSEAAFTVNEKLTRLPAPSDAIGKTQSISGDLYLMAGHGLAQSPPSTFSVDLRTLTSDSSMRDNFIKQSTLQTSQFPMATYTTTGIDGFPTSYKEGDEVKVTISGTMQVHGVQKPVTWTGTARYAGGKLEAVVSTDVTMTEFGMTPPSVPIVQSVDDKVHLDLHLFAAEQS